MIFPILYSLSSSSISPSLSLLRPQLPVAILEGSRWSRGLVTDISSSNFVKVFFVDIGVDKSVPRENLRLLRKDFVRSAPIFAHRCSLAGVVPVEAERGWSTECVEFFKWEIDFGYIYISDIWTLGLVLRCSFKEKKVFWIKKASFGLMCLNGKM